ncbi:dephospho-CoA kinase [Evansella caseinilytica]|uniref:Dephospho-CoA kinase n=1 Tax=Evansella caseinilytica TaxID=1503961 RepID=A0A1H3TVJ0_9BACI|nr:dephospho-CoA kinase [Evansella caseinilytica]
MLKIGLTGGIATGKSTVSLLLKERGFPVVDADNIARQVVEPGRVAYGKIVDVFGTGILNEDNTIARKKLGAIIFQDEENRQKLNSIVHPEVRKAMARQTEEAFRSGSHTVFLDIPLLIESKLMPMVDKIIVVYVPETIQLQRLMARDNLTRAEAESRIQAQMPIDEKLSYASAVLYNDGTLEQTKQQLDQLLQKWDIRK